MGLGNGCGGSQVRIRNSAPMFDNECSRTWPLSREGAYLLLPAGLRHLGEAQQGLREQS